MMSETLQNVRGATQLAFNAAVGLARSVERMHETIARRPLPWARRPDQPTRAHGWVASGVYGLIHGAIGACASAADLSLRALSGSTAERPNSRRDSRVVSALNGVCGDHLESTDNSLAIRMSLVRDGLPLETASADLAAAYPDASPHVLVLVHGLCLSESSWSREGQPDIGSRLNQSLGLTPVFLRYNSGRHISTNGREFSGLLQKLFEHWPVQIQSLTLLGHSMGGLVIRSACWYGSEANHRWVRSLHRVACLGTPHHGSPVEQAGHLLDLAMRAIQYVEPLALGQRRSAGIKDLRHGSLLDEDWLEQDPNESLADQRRIVPLLSGVEYYFAAASLGRHDGDPRGRLLGDMLVSLSSAVGAHDDEHKRLAIKPDHCRIFHEKSHLELLSDPQVHGQIIEWFSQE